MSDSTLYNPQELPELTYSDVIQLIRKEYGMAFGYAKGAAILDRACEPHTKQARIDEVNRFFDHTQSENWQDNATYVDNRIAALEQGDK